MNSQKAYAVCIPETSTSILILACFLNTLKDFIRTVRVHPTSKCLTGHE